MAYGLLLYKVIETPLGSQRVEIYKDGYSGTAIEIAGLHADGITISKDSQSLTQPITTSVLTLRLSDCNEVDYSQFFTPNATLFKVVWQTINGGTTTTRWTGFITPDSYSENLAYRDTLTLTARDNLGRLNDYDFDLAQGQMLSVRAILTAAMTKAGVAMGLTFTTAKVATSPATMLAVDGLVNTTLLQGMTWHEAVELLLTGLGLTLAWNDGNAFEVRDITQAPANTQSAFFINKSGFRQIRPAWKNLTVAQDYGLRDSFYEGQFTADQCGSNPTFTIPSSSKWNYAGTVALLNPYKGAAYPYETIYLPIQGGDGMSNRIVYNFTTKQISQPFKISFNANNTAWIWQDPADAFGFVGISDRSLLATKQSGQSYTMTRYYIRFRINVFCAVGGTVYVLRDKWQAYDESTIEQPYLYFVMPTVLDEYGQIMAEDQDNEVSIYLGQLPGDGQVNVVFYTPVVQTKEGGDPADIALATLDASTYTTPYAKITNLKMAVDDGISGRQMKVAVNPDHNMQGDLSVSLGQVPTGKGNTLLYLGGLFYNDTYYTPLTAFAKAQNGTNYDLLELVGREYITYSNAAYNALSGTMKAASLFRFDKGITFDGNAYRIVGASLAILSNTLSVQLLQQEASFDTAAHTVDAVDEEGSARTATTTGVVAQGGGFNSEILRHLSLQVINEGLENEETIMVCDLTFASEHNIIAGGVGSSGGGGGGGSLATLADVALSSPTEGQVLAYNGTTSHWENRTLAFALADLTDVTGTPSNGQALIWDSTAGKWKPGNVAGGVSVVSADATIGTSLTTLGTIDGTPIKAKIAAYLTQAVADGRYGASLNYASGKLYLVNADNTVISTLNGSDLVTAIGNNAVAMATSDANGKTIASQYWVGQQGFLTSSDISDMATMTWVGQQNFLTSSAISDMATKTWVGQQGYITSSALSGYMLSSDFTAANIVSTLGNTPVNRATKDADGNTISNKYAASLTVYNSQICLQAKDGTTFTTSGTTITGSDLVTVLGNNAVARATADASGNTITTSYLRKDTDDTMSANLAIGARTSTSTAKTLTIYGGTTESACALIIHGVTGSNTSKQAKIWRDNDYLQILASTRIDGNIVATGNIVAGSASDRRLKKNVRGITLGEAADLLSVLNPVVFEWNDKATELGRLSGVSRGFLADEYLDLLPNAGRKIWGIYDAIDYDQVIPYLVAGWQQQNLRIRELEIELDELRRAGR